MAPDDAVHLKRPVGYMPAGRETQQVQQDQPVPDDLDDGRDDGWDDEAELGLHRPRRRRFLVIGGVVFLLLAGGGAVIVSRVLSDDEGGGSENATATELSTATAERRTLEEREDLDGTLGYGEVSQLNVQLPGTITGLPAIGTVIERGQSLMEVDGKPVPLLYGERPLWRQLDANATNGPDIRQLEANLVALGIVTESELTVDGNWTDATTAAVKEWQESLGLDETGVITPGSLVFKPDAVRVAEHPAEVGSPAGGGGLGVTGASRTITIDLEATRQSLVEEGQAVDIELPDGSETTGVISDIGDVATGSSGEEGEEETDPTIELTVTLDDPAASGSLDEAPVTVRVVTSAAEDVLAVPVEALLALSDGGYVVEVMGANGQTSQIEVELGAFADGWVEITGDVAEGDEVVIPSD